MDRRTLIAGGAAIVAVGAIGGFYLTRNSAAPEVTQITPTGMDAPQVDTSSIMEMVQGNADAPVTVTEYASFTCPHCAAFHASPYQSLKSEYIDTGKVKFVYRDVYFDRYGLWAAMIARCDPTKFFGISSMLYKTQRDWLDAENPGNIADNLRKVGRIAGLSDESIETCLADEDMAKTLVAWFEQNAKADDITATPSLLIDGTKHSNMNWADLKSKIDAALDS